jgi:hypothetical protein
MHLPMWQPLGGDIFMKRFSMKKSVPMMMAAATTLALAASASANITLQATQVTLTNATLVANGWVGYRIALIADGTTSTGVQSFDFTNAVSGFTSTSVAKIGISGPLLQSWVVDTSNDDGTAIETPTPTNKVPTTATSNVTDSFWTTFTGAQNFSPGDPPVEDSNLANVASNLVSGYIGSPLADTPAIADVANQNFANGVDNGVGSTLTYSGAIKATASISLTLAFVIVPANLVNGKAANQVQIYGVALDPAGGTFVINSILNPAGTAPVPEPASIGLLGMGVAGLLVRRKR